MKILFLILNFDSASGICVKEVARSLAQKGNNIVILTQNKIKQYKDEMNIEIVTIRPDFLTHVVDEASLSTKKINRVIAKLVLFIQRLQVILAYPTWPFKSPVLSVRLFRAAEHITKEKEIDVVIPIYNAIETLIVGNRIKQKNNHILYIPYFLDSLFGGQTPRFMKEKTKQRKALVWENRLLKNADGIVMMAASKSSYKKTDFIPDYIAKTRFLDLPLLIHQEKENSASYHNCFQKDETVFLFAGSMPRNIRNPEFFLRMFASIDEPSWHLYLVGTSDFDNFIGDIAKKCTRIHRIGTVEHLRMKEMIQEADILVNIGNSLSYMVPSKIFEYMSFNKPIISTYRIVDDPCIPYLELYNKSITIDETAGIKEGADVMKHFVNQICCTNTTEVLSNGTKKKSKKGGALFNNTPDAFVEYLEELYACRYHDFR